MGRAWRWSGMTMIAGVLGAVAGPPRVQAQLAAGEPADAFAMSTWLANVTLPTDIAFHDDGRAVILGKLGDITVRLPNGTRVATPRIPNVDTASDKGLLGVVADPNVAQNHTFYFFVDLGNVTADKHKVVKGILGGDHRFTLDLQNPIVSMGLEGPANHEGSGLVIHEGFLYVSVGDTGDNANPPQNKYGSCLNKPNGKILRVALDGSVPNDNPLVGLGQVTGCSTTRANFAMTAPDTRIWAWGFRNPYRIWMDPATDLLWVADVGESAREEIALVGRGQHHGYPFVEGTVDHTAQQSFNLEGCANMTPSTPCTAPVFEYQTGQGGNNAIIGGLIPDGCGWPDAWKRRYFFGDHGTGTVWTLDVTQDRRGVVANSRRVFGTIRNLASIKQGADGALYFMAHETNAIVRVGLKTVPPACAAPADGGVADAAAPDAGVDLAVGVADAAGGGAGGAAGGAGGEGGGGGAGGAGGGGGMGGAGGGADAGETTSTDGGCGCGLGGRPPASLLAVALLAVALSRRRRWRRDA